MDKEQYHVWKVWLDGIRDIAVIAMLGVWIWIAAK